MTLNAQLSHWQAWRTCYCGRWHAQRAPGHAPESRVCYERNDASRPEISAKIRTWRVVPGGHEWQGPDKCERCNYDLTKSPEDNLRAIKPEVWASGEIVGSDFSSETLVDFLPEGVDVTFARCNLNNVILHDRHTMLGKSVHWQGVVCAHNRIALQTDGRPWVCRWKAIEGKPADSPVRPLDYASAVLEGRNVDPAALPAKALTAEELSAEQQARDRWKARVDNARVYVAADGWTPCTCISGRKVAVEAALGKAVPDRDILPDRKCKLCGGIGAIPPAKVVSG